MIFHALIAARGGSKGLKNKNLKKLNGLPLVNIAIKNAKSSKLFDKIFCSSDSQKILNLAKKQSICIKRPKKISKDNTKTENVVSHYLKFLKINNINKPDVMFLFQPTSPFIKIKTIREMVDVYKKNKNVNSVISIFKVPNKYNYVNQRKINNLSEIKFIFKRKKSYFRRQNKPKVFVHGNLFSIRISEFIKKNSFFLKPIKSIEIHSFKESIDIDDKNDFALAKKLVF